MLNTTTFTLGARLAIAFAGLFLLIGAIFFILANWSTHRYYQEITQTLNKDLAMYIAQRQPLIEKGQVNQKAMKDLAELAMVVNPIVEVYLLDNEGKILAHALPEPSLVRDRVNVKPIIHWLQGNNRYPITGDDPRSIHHERIFSVSPVLDQGQPAGYLYVLLGGQLFQTLATSLQGSYIMQLSLGVVAALILFAIASAAVIFAVLTKPLRKLAQDMNQFQQQEFKSPVIGSAKGDEITYLQRAFTAMRDNIREHLHKLQETDRLRRELISNVSHDLRTPLACMQGYLERLLIQNLSPEERQQSSLIAFKNCRRLTLLIQELFELSKLDAGRKQPQWELFSLAELLQDVVQKFILKAQKAQITLHAQQDSELFMVCADIALIERVLENLIDNALCHTPAGGKVALTLAHQGNQVEVSIQDTGIGMPEEALPYIFERYYRVKKPSVISQETTEHAGNGLGLAIVKRILELHNSVILVESTLNKGTCFRFPLPVQLEMSA